MRPYAFKISDVLRQKNGVTIVENVINPTAGDRTRLSYTLSKSGRVTIQVFSLGGDIVNVLYSGYQAAGDYSASWARAAPWHPGSALRESRKARTHVQQISGLTLPSRGMTLQS